MALITGIIDRGLDEHLVSFAAVWIVAGSAADLHISILAANQMRRALEHGFANVRMAAHASVFGIRPRQHPFGRLAVV